MIRSKEVQSKQPNNGLLGTYFVSLFSVVLSCAMLFGTTYAWFNASRTSVGNVVESGGFNITMSHLPYGENRAVPLSGQSSYQVFSSNVEWKPGTTRMETVEVSNTGTLNAGCTVDFVPIESIGTAAQQFTVYVKEGEVTAAERGLAGPALTDWTCLGTLQTVMDEKTALFTVDELEPGERQRFSVALYTADPTLAMGQSVSLYLHLIAEQSAKP